MNALYLVRCSYTEPKSEPSWNEWYASSHLPEMLAVKGFQRGGRFRAADSASPQYLTRYELTDENVLDSIAYRNVSDGSFPEPWSANIAHLTRWLYTPMAAQSAPEDDRIGLFMVDATISLEHWDEYTRWYDTEHIPQVRATTGCIGGRRYLPINDEPPASHLVLYEFVSAHSLRRFIRDDVPTLLASYNARWSHDSMVGQRTRQAFSGRELSAGRHAVADSASAAAATEAGC